LVIDSIPHWDYNIKSSKKDIDKPLNNDMLLGKDFVGDLLRIGLDALLGLTLSVLLFVYVPHVGSIKLALIGAVAGILPDPLQFVYWKTRSKLLLPLQRFHIWIQEGKSLYVGSFKGLLLQAIVIVVVVSGVLILGSFLKVFSSDFYIKRVIYFIYE
jgi:hypothetical protein